VERSGIRGKLAMLFISPDCASLLPGNSRGIPDLCLTYHIWYIYYLCYVGYL